MDYFLTAFYYLEDSLFTGFLLFFVVLLARWLFTRKLTLTWFCVPELLFCIYVVLMCKLTGIELNDLKLGGILSYNLIPFVGCSFVPLFLNFLFFLPFGFLLPLSFSGFRWDWRKTLLAGFVTSLTLEMLQLLVGRYAEIDDVLINTLGAWSGFQLYTCCCHVLWNWRKAVRELAGLILALLIVFTGIYLVSDREPERVDGFEAVEEKVEIMNLWCNGESQKLNFYDEVYFTFCSQLSNCSGHLLTVNECSADEVLNKTDCFIEIQYLKPATIHFDNAPFFGMEDSDWVIYNANTNQLYWENADGYYTTDFLELNEELEDHREKLLAEYQRLQEQIQQQFQLSRESPASTGGGL